MRHRSSLFRLHAALFSCLVASCLSASLRADVGSSQSAAATTEILDIDANGVVEALTDGLLVMRYTFGLRGQTLIQGAIGSGATRTTAAQIESYLATLTGSQPGTPVTAPGNCSVTQLPNTAASPVTAGTSVALSVSCTAGSAPASCSWSNGVSSTSCSINVPAPSVTTTYSVIASNGSGSAASVDTTINVIVSGDSAQDFCTGTDEIITISWPPSGQFKWNTASFKNQRMAFKLFVPTTFSPSLDVSHSGYMRIVELPGFTVATREVTVSKNSCDFQTGNYLFSNFGSGDTAPYVSYTTNNPNGYHAAGAIMNINSGDTIYFNVRNQNNGGSTCPYTSCDVSLDLATPNRY